MPALQGWQGGEELIDVLIAVRRHHGQPHAGGAGRNGGGANWHTQDASLMQARSQMKARGGTASHEGKNRRGRVSKIPPALGERGSQPVAHSPEAISSPRLP